MQLERIMTAVTGSRAAHECEIQEGEVASQADAPTHQDDEGERLAG